MSPETPSEPTQLTKMEQYLAECAEIDALEAAALQKRRAERLRQKHARKANRPKKRPKKKR